MGIDIDGGMIVGELAADLTFPIIEGMYPLEWAYKQGLHSMSLYYDAELEEHYIGFPVENIKVVDMDATWFKNIRDLAKKFEDIFHVPAKLIGTQNVW